MSNPSRNVRASAIERGSRSKIASPCVKKPFIVPPTASPRQGFETAPAEGLPVGAGNPADADGAFSSFQVSTTHFQLPSDSFRQTVAALPGMAIGFPSGPVNEVVVFANA